MRLSLIISTLLTAVTAVAAQEGQAPGAGGSFMSQILPMMLVMVAIVYFLMIRPEQKKQKEKESMMGGLKKGDKILTIGGVYATVASVKTNTVMAKIADNTTVELAKTAISNVITKETKDSADEAKASGEKQKGK